MSIRSVLSSVDYFLFPPDAEELEEAGVVLPPPSDEHRTDSAALAALILSLLGLSVPALIVAHWAAWGSKRTVALVLGWLGVTIGVVAVAAFLALASSAGQLT